MDQFDYQKGGITGCTQVIIRIEPVQKGKAKLKIISDLAGTWSDDPTITPILSK